MADNDALDAALAQFNAGLEIQQAEEAAKRAVDKAERKKQQAANELKKLQSDPNASAEDKAAADDAYRAAVDQFNKLRSGEAVPDDEAQDEAAEDGAADDAAADTGAAEDGGAAEDESAAPAAADTGAAEDEGAPAGEADADAAEEE